MDDCFIRYKILSYEIRFNDFSRCFPSIIGGLYPRLVGIVAIASKFAPVVQCKISTFSRMALRADSNGTIIFTADFFDVFLFAFFFITTISKFKMQANFHCVINHFDFMKINF